MTIEMNEASIERKKLYELVSNIAEKVYDNYVCKITHGDYGTSVIQLYNSSTKRLVVIEMCKNMSGYDNTKLSIEYHFNIKSHTSYSDRDSDYKNLLCYLLSFKIHSITLDEIECIIKNAVFTSINLIPRPY